MSEHFLVAFPEDRTSEVVEMLKKSGYEVACGAGICFGIYPKELMGIDFVSFGEEPPTDYPLEPRPHPRNLSHRYDEDGKLIIGFNVVPASCAHLDIEKSHIVPELEGYPAAQKHHKRIQEALSAFAIDSASSD